MMRQLSWPFCASGHVWNFALRSGAWRKKLEGSGVLEVEFKAYMISFPPAFFYWLDTFLVHDINLLVSFLPCIN